MARVPANSYPPGPRKSSGSSGSSGGSSSRKGDKYLGGNTFLDRETGERYDVTGDYTSPSGKTSHIDSDGTVTTTGSRDKSQIGNTYRDGELIREYSASYGDTFNPQTGGVGMQVSALEEAMGNNRSALNAAYNASRRELEGSTDSAMQQAYLNSQKALKAVPQTMAAAGYNGGVTETTAAGIQNEYQNALTELEKAKATELARLQANLAKGIADSDSQYQIQLANALAQAERLAYEKEKDEMDFELRKRLAALEEEKYQDSKNKPSGTSSESPTAASYFDALKQAQQQGSVAPLMAYYKSRGMTDAQIANMINASVGDSESAIYGYNK